MELDDVRCLTVLGLRRSGLPAALLGRRKLPAARVVGIDEGGALPEGTVATLHAAGVEVLLGAEAELPEDADLLIKSPGVPDESPTLRAALRRGVVLWSEVELAARFLRNRVVGITGTNGKTTTTELTGAILRDAGLPVAVAGNIGVALAGLPDAIPAEATVVAELSSFQLEHVERFRPDVAVLLNLSADHLDRHGSYARYVDAKLRVFARQRAADVAVLNADDAGTLAEAARLSGAAGRLWFSAAVGRADGPAGVPLAAGVRHDAVLWLSHEGRRVGLCAAAELSLRGEHNLQNSLAAAVAACAVGAPPEAAAATLRTFAGVPHRLQVVGEIDGVTYVNDSKATNVDATLKALTAYSGGVHLVLGGYDKQADFARLALATEGRVKQALLIGAAAPLLEDAFSSRRGAVGDRATPFVVCGDLGAALRRAAREAVAGDVVLLSPACASWDQYRDYVERGEHFLRLVSELRGADTS